MSKRYSEKDLEERYYTVSSFEKESAEGKGTPKFDMTPMTDLAFLLLTFFMITTTFARPQIMNLVMPEDTETQNRQPLKESQALHVVISTGDQLYWYTGKPGAEFQTSGFEQLPSLLTRQQQQTAELMVLIKPTDDTDYENVVKAIDAVNLAGIERYALLKPAEADQRELAKR